MSSSQAQETTVEAQKELECVVCGKTCWTRCSACGANGTEWMYFCSIEHQKLIWPVHKRFCGVNSSPLRWPLLSDCEADEAREVLRNFRREQSKTSAKSKEFEGLGFVEFPGSSTHVDLENVLPHILEASEPSIAMSNKNRILFTILFRRELYRIKVKLAERREPNSQLNPEDPSASERETARDPIGALLNRRGFEKILLNADQHQEKVDIFLHRIFIHSAVLARYYADFSQLENLRPCLDYTRELIHRQADMSQREIDIAAASSLRQNV
ncbi:zinc finger MYND domain-containing protein [Sporobolomyces salmoneus]|uniref:zinc finger MYND domain-containing protein n=1 Tax=Sporobolomyces salmoneus TaxID=183962 RepID=UPI0031827960